MSAGNGSTPATYDVTLACAGCGATLRVTRGLGQDYPEIEYNCGDCIAKRGGGRFGDDPKPPERPLRTVGEIERAIRLARHQREAEASAAWLSATRRIEELEQERIGALKRESEAR